MPFSQLRALAYRIYGPALLLRRVLPRERRRAWESRLAAVSGLVFFCAVVLYAAEQYQYVTPLSLVGFPVLSERLFGLFGVLFAGTVVIAMLDALYRSYYHRGMEQVLEEERGETIRGITWPVATIIDDTPSDDFTAGFIGSSFGQEVLYRAGVVDGAFGEFVAHERQRIPVEEVFVEKDSVVTLVHYTKTLLRHDATFARFIAQQGITEDTLLQAAGWVMRIDMRTRQQERWWSRDNLGRIPSIGRSWSYGQTHLLNTYGHDMRHDAVWAQGLVHAREEYDEVDAIEHILVRARQANVLVVGDDSIAIKERLVQLYHLILRGQVLSPLESHRIHLLDVEGIIMEGGEKMAIESTISRACEEAIAAGNIVLYIDALPQVLQSAREVGVDVVETLRPYLESDVMQVVCGADKRGFQELLAGDKRVSQLFDVVRMHELDDGSVVRLLEQRAYMRERYGVVCSVGALQAIAQYAEQYFPGGVMPDKAFDLFEELLPYAVERGIAQVKEGDVANFVEGKIGVPVGSPDTEERAALLSLTDTLTQRVFGQDTACQLLAETLQRARSGVRKGKKPMGSFLFLGPTGVGKTQTAKVLADVFFGGEANMARLDMSEFQKPDALAALIGATHMNETVGALDSVLQERPYGVLLLDEFEKAHRTVHDLFLQILDEGWYTNTRGDKVYATNTIIIATSNAGTDTIWQWQKEGKQPAEHSDALVDVLVETGTFRPELINRFDGVVVFEPLSKETVRAIAQMKIAAAAKTVRDTHHVTLVLTDDAYDALVEVGYQPQFGARPLVRAIEQRVMQTLAEKTLSGAVAAGETLTITADDIYG
jgi:ATP-dependent Clp protease ATP-binding subunit ClpC